eukprot:CAMPEP_0113501294 /NCGR_PEP_ID=MMETSP0014_2-20120614/32868_1 /TAXON_ID=2857 /ORGANISM="Nitzschia sp." /LENGTH=789 /DNA_ID=CAMNT_0000395853 /DNA_START=244 /DNA_END=2613 /DNA_ORIENTATION=- /assembly_acc=CAM_ASM_000159
MQKHGRGSPSDPSPSSNEERSPVVGAHPTTTAPGGGTNNNTNTTTAQQQQQQQQQQQPVEMNPAGTYQGYQQQLAQMQQQPQHQQTAASSISPHVAANQAEQIRLPMLPLPPHESTQQAAAAAMAQHQHQQQQQQQQQPMLALSSSSPFTSLQYATPPSNDPNPTEAEQLLTGAMYGLATEERDQALADVHGVAAAGGLDNEFIANRLAQLDQAIHDLRTNKSAYLRAKIQSPEYVSDRKFRLQFLLADSFQPVAAAERLVSYFESKLVLFGPDKLTKDLTLQDLDQQDIACLEYGLVQRLVGRDHAGRVVVSCWPSQSTNGTAMAGPPGGGGGGGLFGSASTEPTPTSQPATEGPQTMAVTDASSSQQYASYGSGVAPGTAAQAAAGAPYPYTAEAAPAPAPSSVTAAAPVPDDPSTGLAATASAPVAVGTDSPASEAEAETNAYHDHYVRYECDQIIDLDTWKHQLKAYWYMVTSIGDEEQDAARRNGFVSVVFGMGPHQNADRMALWKIMYLFRSLPVRVSSIHYCFDDPQSKALADLSVIALDPKSRARFRTHYGTQDQVVSELSAFGIGTNLLTVDPRSEEAAMVISEWFATRRLKESTQAAQKTAPPSTSIADVGHYDVLFGRGKGIQAHPGNKRLRELVEANLERYDRASRLEKTLMAETIVRNIKDTSGRFLKLDNASQGGGWTEVNDEIARDKIAHAFRTQRKSLLQKEKESALARAQQQRTQHAPSPIPYAPTAPASMAGTGHSNSNSDSRSTSAGSSQLMNPQNPSQFGGNGGGSHMY